VGMKGRDIQLVSRQPTEDGQSLSLLWRGRELTLHLPLIGAYQAENALVAAGLALATSLSDAQVQSALTQLQPVRGRLELATRTAMGAPVFVDYAHTPDGLRAALEALRPHTKSRLIIVFGAGGDRDAGKRPLMGQMASQLADVVIVTDDNPRSEDAAMIRAAVMAGAGNAHNIGDRREAIKAAMAMAEAGDVVLIAGKGHEQGQIVGDTILEFDDVTVARESVA
jgi:UDP-N-acetylmuramoyl-L-alanyl-D-glutamate--2,6-diaminopimelate ligase